MSFLKRYGPAFVSGAGVSILAVFLFAERPAKEMSNVLDPTMAGHEPVDVWHGDWVEFTCPNCPNGSQFRIDKVELFKAKILAELGSIPGTQAAQDLVSELPPRPSLGSVPSSPFGAWTFPTSFVNKGASITTAGVPSEFASFSSSQFYSVTWTVRASNGTMQTFDPHIYAHGGKRR